MQSGNTCLTEFENCSISRWNLRKARGKTLQNGFRKVGSINAILRTLDCIPLAVGSLLPAALKVWLLDIQVFSSQERLRQSEGKQSPKLSQFFLHLLFFSQTVLPSPPRLQTRLHQNAADHITWDYEFSLLILPSNNLNSQIAAPTRLCLIQRALVLICLQNDSIPSRCQNKNKSVFALPQGFPGSILSVKLRGCSSYY